MARRRASHVPQRQILVILASMSASVGLAKSIRQATTAMLCPDWQYPHCGTPSSIHARCTGWLLSEERPSMVRICAPSRAPIGTEHDRMAVPLICTVQAPHCAIPQPNFVPVKPITSRSTQRSGVSGSIPICRDAPLMLIVINVNLLSLKKQLQPLGRDRLGQAMEPCDRLSVFPIL